MAIERKERVVVESNVYTALVAVALCLTLVTIGLVVFKCYNQYGIIFQIGKPY
jgi:hypothetical protein